MTHCKTNQIKAAYNRYNNSYNYSLWDVYASFSRAKENAFNYCKQLAANCNGSAVKIIGANSNTFSAGFLCELEGKPAFVYITKDYDHYIFIDEIINA